MQQLPSDEKFPLKLISVDFHNLKKLHLQYEEKYKVIEELISKCKLLQIIELEDYLNQMRESLQPF